MTRRLSIRDSADVARDGIVSLPITTEPGTRAPEVCVSLKSSGDMSRPPAGPGAGAEGTGDGDSPRTALLDRLGIAGSRVSALHQVHSQRVVVVEEEWHEGMEGDGLVTADASRVLAVTVADCLPIFLYDRRTGAMGLLHSGWRGTGIAALALARMADRFGTAPQDVSAVIGPGIGPCCYRVNEDRAALFAERWGEAAVVRRDDRPYLDLPSINERILLSAGVVSVARVAECTACSPFLGSFRREGPEHYTKMLALIGYFR